MKLLHIIFTVWVESESKNGFRKGLLASFMISKNSSIQNCWLKYASHCFISCLICLLSVHREENDLLLLLFIVMVQVSEDPCQERAYDYLSED